MTADDVLATIDRDKYAEIAERWAVGDGSGERREKYLDLPLWIDRNLKRARAIGLDVGPPRRVLDLGCGCGYFLYVCRLLGHEAIGIDRAEERSLFTDMRDLLGVRSVDHTIRPFEPLPDLGRFDVVTAHMVTFNGHRRTPWGVAEWSRFLDLLPAPVVHLGLNREPDGTLYPPGVLKLFHERGVVL